MNQAQPALRKPLRRDQASTDLDPAKIGVTLRELALQAHQLVRAINGSDVGSDQARQELTKVHARIVHLQRNLGSHQLDDLVTYVSALRKRVEECLA